MSFPSQRRFDINSIGVYCFDVGRPTATSTRKWIQRCNFVFKTVARIVKMHDDTHLGWLIEIFLENTREESKQCFVSLDCAASTSQLRRCIMGSVSKSVCRMNSDDFLRFVDADGVESEMYLPRHIGKVYIKDKAFWVFPSVVLDGSGRAKDKSRFFIDTTHLRRRDNGDTLCLPPELPLQQNGCEPVSIKSFRELSKCLRRTYGERYVRVCHLLTSAIKGILFDSIMKHEHFVPPFKK